MRIVKPLRFTVSVVMVIVVTGLIGFKFYEKVKPIPTDTLRQVEVASGDTLWSIAEQYTDEDTNIRRYIDAVQEINQIDENDNIHEGDKLFIPVIK